MKTQDFTSPITSRQLNENMFKKFGVKVDFDKYTREELENYRNLLRTKISQHESASNFSDLLTNETYQKDKYLVGLLNTRIKEMLGESIEIMERKLSGSEKKKKEEVVKSMKKDKGGFKKRYGDRGEEVMHATATKIAKKVAESDKGDMDHDGKDEPDSKEYMDNKDAAIKKAMGKNKKVKEAQVEEGWDDMLAANKKKAAEKGTGKFDKKQTSTGTQYTRKSSTFSDGGDDSDVKKAKKAAKVKEGTKNLPGNQEKIDVDHDGKIEKSDLAKLRAGKKKSMKESQHKQNVKVVNESVLKLLAEDEEGKAKTITAGADMVNDFTSWMTRIGQYQTKSMIELADTIRANFGQGEAEQFKSAVAPALETALNTLTQCREEISNAVAVLAGEAPAADAMGGDMGGDMGMAGSEEIPDAGMDSMNGGDEFGASDAAAGGEEIAGRAQRESRELFARKLSEAHSIIGRLAK